MRKTSPSAPPLGVPPLWMVRARTAMLPSPRLERADAAFATSLRLDERWHDAAMAADCAALAAPAASNALVLCVAALPRPRLPRAAAAFARSDRLSALSG